jgi:hypothetical protein
MMPDASAPHPPWRLTALRPDCWVLWRLSEDRPVFFDTGAPYRQGWFPSDRVALAVLRGVEPDTPFAVAASMPVEVRQAFFQQHPAALRLMRAAPQGPLAARLGAPEVPHGSR